MSYNENHLTKGPVMFTKIDVSLVNAFTEKMKTSANKKEFKDAYRYFVLAMQECHRQYHISKAHKIHDKMMETLFSIEIDENFDTYQDATK